MCPLGSRRQELHPHSLCPQSPLRAGLGVPGPGRCEEEPRGLPALLSPEIPQSIFRAPTAGPRHGRGWSECTWRGLTCVRCPPPLPSRCPAWWPCPPRPSHLMSVAADKAVSMQQGLCYRWLGPGTCTLPLAQRITKQICCCSRVGKAWGSKCEKCPLPGTGKPRAPSAHWPPEASLLAGAGGPPSGLEPLGHPSPSPPLPPTSLPVAMAPTGQPAGRARSSLGIPAFCRGLSGDLSCRPRLHLLQLRHPPVHEEGRGGGAGPASTGAKSPEQQDAPRPGGKAATPGG